MIEFVNDYTYFYETHLHTMESSKCAVTDAISSCRAHKEAGYSGMFLTNHNWGGNTSVDRSLKWCDFIDEFFKPFYLAREWGEKNDFQVFEGYEAGYDGTEFLIYGISVDWMRAHPELKDATVEEQFDIIHEGGGIVVHAHPFREAFYIPKTRLYPDFVDGVEGINAAHSSPYQTNERHPIWDEKAIAYAGEHKLPLTAGSDVHSTNVLYGGMAFRTKLSGAGDFTKRVCTAYNELEKGNIPYLITNGGDWFDCIGRRI